MIFRLLTTRMRYARQCLARRGHMALFISWSKSDRGHHVASVDSASFSNRDTMSKP